MLRKTLLTAAALAALTMPAFAFQCPTDMAAIDQELATADLSESERQQVMELRQRGEELHEAGQHDQSVEVLAQAKDILGIE